MGTHRNGCREMARKGEVDPRKDKKQDLDSGPEHSEMPWSTRFLHKGTQCI